MDNWKHYDEWCYKQLGYYEDDNDDEEKETELESVCVCCGEKHDNVSAYCNNCMYEEE